MEDELKIDDAIRKHLSLWLTEESKHNIESEYGVGTLEEVTAICHFADNLKVWQQKGFSEAHPLTIEQLKSKYPFLSMKSARKVADMAAYSNK